MGGAGSKNGINTDFVSTNNTLDTNIDTEYTAKIGDENSQRTDNLQMDEQLDSIGFSGSVNTGGGDININPVQANTQIPKLDSIATQEITITHSK